MHLDFWKQFFNCGKIAQKRQYRPKRISTRTVAPGRIVGPILYVRITAYTWRHRASGYSTRYLRQCGPLSHLICLTKAASNALRTFIIYLHDMQK